jgi:predicted O-linked N-acetylglucosamine transferase (SPINDLY family)
MKARRALEEAISAQRQGLLTQSDKMYSTVVRKFPDYFDALHFYGLFKYERGQFDDALRLVLKATKINPRSANAFNSLGVILGVMGRHIDALASFNSALALDENHVPALSNRGNSLNELGRHEDAIDSADRALAINSSYIDAYIPRAAALLKGKRYAEALESYERSIKLNPNFAVAWLGRGNVLGALQRNSEALVAFDKVLVLNPELTGAWFGRGNVLAELRRHSDAVVAFERALKLDPGLQYAQGYRLHSKQHVCDWSNLESEWERLLKELRNNTARAAPFPILAAQSSSADQVKSARIYTSEQHCPLHKQFWKVEPYSHSRIRVAYMSPDFRDHAVARLLASLFENHDRTSFETIAVALGPDDQSAMRARLKQAFDHFVEVGDRSDLDVARQIQQMEVDILVDLAGFTSGSRPAILTFRPAPIQVTYLSYPGLMGGGYIDYMLADRFVIPEHHRALLSEQVVYLPNSYLAYDTKQNISERIPSRAEQGLPESGFVFCAYNSPFKITPHVFNIWMRLLRNVSGSVLWLMGMNATVVSNLRREAQARGVDPDRLCFAPFEKDIADHLARYRLADLFLDTLPFNAQTTACDALWAGLPVLTCLGSTFVGRAAGSLLSAIDMPELITHSVEEYEALALKLATNPLQLADIRRKLANNRLTTPLFDSRRFTKHMEAAYRAMVERHRAGLPPDQLIIS